MREVFPNILIGTIDDYEGIKGNSDYFTVIAAKEPYHRRAVGYSGRSCGKDNPEYLYAERSGCLTTAAHNGYTEQLKRFGMTAADCVNYFNKLAGTAQNAAGGVNDIAEAAFLSEKELAALEKEITNFEKGISSINGYIQTLNEGNGLTAEQVLELCDNYGLLSEQFTLTEKGYQIEVSALEQLREAQAQEAIAARNSQIEQTKVLQSGIIERLKAYGIEINSIANLAEAQEALASVSTMTKDNQYGVNNAQDALKQQALHSIAAEIRDIANAYEETEKLADGFYKTLGVSFDTKKKETDVLKEITAAFEHLVDIGVYSIDEQIGRLYGVKHLFTHHAHLPVFLQ